MIVVDSREPKKIKKLGDKTDTLDAGDLLIMGSEGKIVIERKSLGDLMGSINARDKGSGKSRFWMQMESIASMREDGYVPFVVVIGNLYWYMKKGWMTPPQWVGIQLSVAKFGVSFAHCDTEVQFKTMVDCWDRKCGDVNAKYVRPTVKKGERTIREERVDMLSAVKGIGMSTAEKMVDEFGNISVMVEAMGYNTDIFIKILGEERFKHLKEVIG